MQTRYDMLDEMFHGYRVIRYFDGRRFMLVLSGPLAKRGQPVYRRYSKQMYLPAKAKITKEWAESVLADPDLAPLYGPFQNLR